MATKVEKNVLGLATIAASLLRRRAQACVVLACLAAMPCATHTASALEGAQTDTRLVRAVQSRTTTGDLEYPGTALEIADEAGKELFHVVVDSQGERQVLFFPRDQGYRISVEVMERILARANEVVNSIDDKS
jgi:hypothetical protein